MPSSTECAKAQEVIRKCRRVEMPAETGKCFRRNKGADIDAGSFSAERLAKVGDELVTQAIDDAGGKQELAPEDKKTPKANLCTAATGMQLVTHNGTMALRLCVGSREQGFLAPVSSAVEAKRIGLEFSECKKTSTAEKCARKSGATVRG